MENPLIIPLAISMAFNVLLVLSLKIAVAYKNKYRERAALLEARRQCW